MLQSGGFGGGEWFRSGVEGQAGWEGDGIGVVVVLVGVEWQSGALVFGFRLRFGSFIVSPKFS